MKLQNFALRARNKAGTGRVLLLIICYRRGEKTEDGDGLIALAAQRSQMHLLDAMFYICYFIQLRLQIAVYA